MTPRKLIEVYPGFPKQGIDFFDLSPIYRQPNVVRELVSEMCSEILSGEHKKIDAVVAPDARGFILGSLLADRLSCAFVPVRKHGKLPGELFVASYELEYGTDKIYMQHDALKPGSSVVIHDDLLATGGTARATADLVQQAGSVVLAFSFTAEIVDLGARAALAEIAPVSALIQL